jgi:hypothetical protein
MPTPLRNLPYASRNQSDPVYSLIGFKPGTSLQASELNELQENLLSQYKSNLSFLYDIVSGSNFNYSPQIGSIKPFFTSLNALSLSSNTDETLNLNISITNKICIVLEQFRYWTNPSEQVISIPVEGVDVYVDYEIKIIPCSTNPDDEGYSFNDNSGSSDGGVGADRLKISASLNTSTTGQKILSILPGEDNQYIITDELGRTRTINI